MKALLYSITLLIICSNYSLKSQTSEYGNLEIYSRETSFSVFSYLSGSFPLSSQIGGERISINGMSYSNVYDLAKVASVVPTSQLEINFMLKGIFKIGAGFGSHTTTSVNDSYPNQEIKYYLVNLDFFTMSFQPEITYVFNDGHAATLFFGFDLINVGGSAAILESGDLKKHTIGIINIVPFGFRPGSYFDFGRSALGISFYINAVNFFEYRILSKDLYSEQSGIQTTDAFVRRFEFQLLYTF